MHKRKCWNTFIYLSCKWVWIRRYRGLPPLTMLGNMWFWSLIAVYSILLQWGRVSHLSAEHILSKRGHIILVGGRRSIHNIMESKSIPERALGPLRLPFSLVVLATKTQPSILPQAGCSSHPGFCSDLFSSPFQSVLRICHASSRHLQIFSSLNIFSLSPGSFLSLLDH